MSKFMCFQDSREVFDFKGNSLGQGGPRAIYKLKSISKRFYRRGWPEKDKTFELATFPNIEAAQAHCDHVNKLNNDDFKPVEI